MASYVEDVDGNDLGGIEEVVRDRWYDLDRETAQRIVDAVASVGDRDLIARPQVLSAAVISLHLLGFPGNQPLGGWPQTGSGEAQRGDQGALLERLTQIVTAADARADGSVDVAWLTLAMIAARWRGDFSRALEVSARLDASGSARLRLMTGFEANELSRPGNVALQRGLTALLAERGSTAMNLFAEAYRASQTPPYRHFAGVNAAANAAMLAAFEGYADLAESWIGRMGDPTAVPVWCRDLLTIGSEIARCVLALDRLDLASAGSAASYLERVGERFELWPFQLAALTAHDLAAGEPVAAYTRLKRVGFERGITISSEPIADHVVFRAYLDTLIAGGEGGLVPRLAKDMGNPLRALVPLARVHLLADDLVGASRLAGQAMRRVLIPKRDMWEAAVIHAIANMRGADPDVARRSFGIVLTGDPALLPGMLARYRAEDVADLYVLLGRRPPEPTPHLTAPGVAPVVVLTSRESDVLQCLADGLAPQQIAALRFISENTVRTHVKNIYRKLGVGRREDAIARASYLGLLRWDRAEGTRGPM